ncbi:MerR family transcriptional regulator [Tropicimonas sp.]|uniref:MerR family transcriptional regulator n=1 Tax=Tropicimonas sp. TaxID=2067044 RepID=UPI003A8C401F
MSLFYSEKETVETVGGLTKRRLTSYVSADLVRPAHSDAGPRYTGMDLARLELICELSDTFGMQDEALELVMSLLDQLHGMRAEMRALASALDREPDEVRARITEAVKAVG